MSKEFLDDYANKLLEVHEQPGEVFCWLNSDRFKFKIDPRIQSVEIKTVDGEPTKAVMIITTKTPQGVAR